MNIVDKLYRRIKKYEELFDGTPSVLLLTKAELDQLFAAAESEEKLIRDLAVLGMSAQLIMPEEISHVLEILSIEQLTILLVHPNAKVRALAEQEVRTRRVKSD